MNCIFCKIAAGEIPSEKLYEDDLVVAIRDIRPQAPTHVLVMSRAHVESLWELEDEALGGRLMRVAADIARFALARARWKAARTDVAVGRQELIG